MDLLDISNSNHGSHSLAQSVRNRTVLKYDLSTRQVVQVPKSELGNSIEVLRPASDIVVETPEEVEERFDNTLAENLDEEAIAIVKDELRKTSKKRVHSRSPRTRCCGDYEDDPENPGCCKLKPGKKPGFTKRWN